jgi:hypothetical protein
MDSIPLLRVALVVRTFNGSSPFKETIVNKFVLSALAAAALCVGNSSFAQDGGAECQAGSAWGPKPGCGAGPSPGTPMPYANQRAWMVPQDAAPAAVLPYQAYAYGNRVYGPNVYPDEARPHYRHGRARRGDRDGDGVADRHDRAPDDPRYR